MVRWCWVAVVLAASLGCTQSPPESTVQPASDRAAEPNSTTQSDAPEVTDESHNNEPILVGAESLTETPLAIELAAGWTDVTVHGSGLFLVHRTESDVSAYHVDPDAGLTKVPAHPVLAAPTSSLGGSVSTGTEFIVCCDRGAASYSHTTRSWVDLPPPPFRATAALVSTGDVVYAVSAEHLAAFDPEQQTWTALAAPPGGIDLVMPGRNVTWTGSELVVLDVAYPRTEGVLKYEPEADVWTRHSSVGVPTIPVALSVGDHLVAVGSLNGPSGPLAASRYDVASQRWLVSEYLFDATRNDDGNAGSVNAVVVGDKVVIEPGLLAGSIDSEEPGWLLWHPVEDTWQSIALDRASVGSAVLPTRIVALDNAVLGITDAGAIAIELPID